MRQPRLTCECGCDGFLWRVFDDLVEVERSELLDLCWVERGRCRQLVEESGIPIQKGLNLSCENSLIIASRLVTFDVRQAEFDQDAANI